MTKYEQMDKMLKVLSPEEKGDSIFAGLVQTKFLDRFNVYHEECQDECTEYCDDYCARNCVNNCEEQCARSEDENCLTECNEANDEAGCLGECSSKCLEECNKDCNESQQEIVDYNKRQLGKDYSFNNIYKYKLSLKKLTPGSE